MSAYRQAPLPLTGPETGIEVGLKAFLITAEGQRVENPRHYPKAEKARKKAQQRVARRKQGRKRRRKKAVHVLAKRRQQVRRQRRDFHHKTALALVCQYDTIYVEAIQPANLSCRPAPQPEAKLAGGECLSDCSTASLACSSCSEGLHLMATLSCASCCSSTAKCSTCLLSQLMLFE